ncbi:MAG: hypothetical protein ABIJ84_01260 [bacterium]
MNFSVFLTRDNIIFFSILCAVLAVFILIFFIILRAIFRIIKALIKRFSRRKEEGHPMEGALTDKGEDISLQVEELEKSRRETAMAQDKEQPMQSIKTPPLQYHQTTKSENKELKTDEEKENEKEGKDIEASLEKLKNPDDTPEKKSFLEEQAEARHGGFSMPKIKIPVSRRHRHEDAPSALEEEKQPASKTQTAEENKKVENAPAPPEDKNQTEVKSKTPPAKTQVAQKDETDKQIKNNLTATLKPKGEVRQPADESPINRAKAEKESGGLPEEKTPQGQVKKNRPIQQSETHSKIQPAQEKGISNQVERTEAEKEEISPYKKPDFMKDELEVNEIKDKKDIEEESFLEEQSKIRLEKIFGSAPVSPKIEISVAKKDSHDKPELENNQAKGGQQAGGSPLKRARSQEEPLEQVDSQKPGLQPAGYKKEKEAQTKEEGIPLYEKPDFMKDELGVGERQKNRKAARNGSSPINRAKAEEGIPLYEKPDFMKDELGIGARQKGVKLGGESALFGNKEEISRIELRRKLRRDSGIWKAQKDVRLNLKPMERVKLEKEFFSKIYGRNISKKDVKVNLRRMGKEWASTPNLKRKETLRKQIKFLKNVSGIKNPYK